MMRMRDVCDLEAITDGNFSPQSTTFSIRDATKEIIKYLDWESKQKCLDIRLKIDSDLSSHVYLDC